MFLNLLGNIFVSREANFVSATMCPRVDNQGNICGNIDNHRCFAQGLSLCGGERITVDSERYKNKLVKVRGHIAL